MSIETSDKLDTLGVFEQINGLETGGRTELETFPLPEGELRNWVDELKLPEGYALIGGAARYIAAKVLFGVDLPVRDIDVAAFEEYGPDMSKADEVARRLMPDDYAFGHGVQVTSMTEYFESRDFTMNEVAVIGGRIILSTRARQDIADNVIRPTIFEHDPEHEWYLHPRLAVKAVLLQAVLEESTDRRSDIKGVELEGYRCDLTDREDGGWTRPFFVALGFQKALEYGENVAEAFLDGLQRHGMIRADSLLRGSRDIDARFRDFANEVASAGDFEFRGEASELLRRMSEQPAAGHSLGDLLHVTGGMEFDKYIHYHNMAQNFTGKGKEYTDESKY